MGESAPSKIVYAYILYKNRKAQFYKYLDYFKKCKSLYYPNSATAVLYWSAW